MLIFRLSLCLLFLAAQAAIAPELHAQVQPPGTPLPSLEEVVGFSYIQPGNGSQIVAYAATEMGAYVAAYYDAEVDGYLYQDGSQVAYGTASGGIAEGSLEAPSAAAMFQLNSYHYLLPYLQPDDNEDWSYFDPYGFSYGGGGQSGEGWIVVDAPLYLDPYYYTNEWQIGVGGTFWQQYGAAPQINGISPNGMTLNSSGTLSIVGLNLTASGTDPNPTVDVVSGSGLTLGGVQVVSDSELDLSYTVDSNPNSTGLHGITVTTVGGTSNTAYVQVGDPTPVITSISPNTWNAGATTTFTIYGSGFGTNPAVTVTGSGVTGYSVLGSPSDTLITASVTVDASSLGGTGTVTVQSQGYNGSGFVPVQQGQSSQTQKTVSIQKFTPPVPQIWFNGNNIAGKTTAVYIGQQIALTALVNLPNGATPTSQSWNRIPQSSGLSGTVVAGYSPQQASGAVLTLPGGGNCQTLNDSCLTFYWVDAGTWQWRYTYTYADQSNSAVATFNVLGPVTSTPEIGSQIGVAQAIVNRSTGSAGLYLAGVPFQGGQVGIQLQTSALPAPGNNGTYQWVQIVNSDQIRIRTATGTLTCLSPTGYPALDNHYPYGIPGSNVFSVSRPNDTATDNPGISLNAAWGEVQRLFSATMYLMWDPVLPAGCSPATTTNASTCTSIPIPLASIAWQFPGNGINTIQSQSNGTTWVVPCGPGQASQCAAVAPGTDPRQSFPQWSKVFTNGSYSCQ